MTNFPDPLDEIASITIVRPVLYQRWEDDGLDECTDERPCGRCEVCIAAYENYCRHQRPDDAEFD